MFELKSGMVVERESKKGKTLAIAIESGGGIYFHDSKNPISYIGNWTRQIFFDPVNMTFNFGGVHKRKITRVWESNADNVAYAMRGETNELTGLIYERNKESEELEAIEARQRELAEEQKKLAERIAELRK